MKMATTAVVILTLACAGHTLAAQAAVQPRWLIGCWAGEVRGAHIEERWVAAGADTLIGVGTTVASGKLREFEFLRILVEGPTVSYVAQPGGRPPTTFVASSGSESEVIFENPQHDFPKRVVYRRTGTSLLASVDNGAADTARRQQFPLERVACDR